MNAGKYTARLDEYGLSESKAGNMQIYITFAINAERVTAHLGLNQTVNEGKKNSQWDITLKNLQTMGFKGGIQDVPKLYDGVTSMALDTLTDYELILEFNKYIDNNGNEQEGIKVKYINKPGEGGGVGKKFASKEEMMMAFGKSSQVGTAKPLEKVNVMPIKSGADAFS